MTVVTMSLYPSPPAHHPPPSAAGHLTIRPPHSILSATLTAAKTSNSLLSASSVNKGKLGFSIDSIVGEKSPKREPSSPEPPSPVSRSPRDRSPLFRARSPSPGEDYRRSPSPSTGHYARSDSPPSPSLLRPIPTSGPLSGSPSINTQSYLDQLAQLKAFYDSRGAAAAAAAAGLSQAGPPASSAPLLPPGLSLPGLHPAAVLQAALPRPPVAGGLPPFLGGLPGQHPNLPGQQLPREYPLYPWFLNRNRFPGGKLRSV